MIWTVVLLPLLLISSLTASAMQIDADPRTIVSFMDKALSPELDILSVATDISPDNHLVFQVKTRGERAQGEVADHLLLRILHGKVYVFLIPINKENGNKVLMYETALQPDNTVLPHVLKAPQESSLPAGLNAGRIVNGAEFILPIEWIDFGKEFGFEAYTVSAQVQGDTLEISRVHDQAGKGRGGSNKFSAITLLNKLCTPQRLRSRTD
ncbi:hypothetical protein SAMN05216412_10198 [Nitrosospira multiformis]|uniref:Uncharacterized protein n=1 Tax=Nitrosospira multiformis TaxID=1231 RepID=A0A1H9Y854_9PROT|nr:hypothetical protein [Nitrosospira multiformis]SES65118.1 hypothetical protein SAMN05216412_10198 [Nitrosospira multiformis]